jgi:hypothetical protein
MCHHEQLQACFGVRARLKADILRPQAARPTCHTASLQSAQRQEDCARSIVHQQHLGQAGAAGKAGLDVGRGDLRAIGDMSAHLTSKYMCASEP